jgi:hypothetical protein
MRKWVLPTFNRIWPPFGVINNVNLKWEDTLELIRRKEK